MALHILLSNATRRPYSDVPKMPEEATYDPAQGVWIFKGGPMVRSPEFSKNPVTKKCDQETGEDQKGE